MPWRVRASKVHFLIGPDLFSEVFLEKLQGSVPRLLRGIGMVDFRPGIVEERMLRVVAIQLVLNLGTLQRIFEKFDGGG